MFSFSSAQAWALVMTQTGMTCSTSKGLELEESKTSMKFKVAFSLGLRFVGQSCNKVLDATIHSVLSQKWQSKFLISLIWAFLYPMIALAIIAQFVCGELELSLS